MKKRDDIIAGSLLMTTAVVGMLAFATSSFVAFPPKIAPHEQILADFAPTLPPLVIRQPIPAVGLTCPVSLRVDPLATPPASFPPGIPPAPENGPAGAASAADAPLPAADLTPTVSLIIFDESKRLAIINGKVTKEGDRHAQWRVTRIEKTRVLLKEGKEERWLQLK